MINEVTARFDQKIKTVFESKPEIKHFLLKHERKPVVLSNLCDQIMTCEDNLLTFDAAKYHATIDSVAMLFAETALAVAEQELVSHAERKRLEQEAYKKDELEKAVAAEVTEETTVTES